MENRKELDETERKALHASDLKQRVKGMLDRFDPKHPQTITMQMFINAFKNAKKEREQINDSLKTTIQNSGADQGIAQYEIALKRLMPKQKFATLTVFDKFYQQMKLNLGANNARSLKYRLLANLFQLNENDEKNAKELIACVIDHLDQVKAKEKREDIQLVLDSIKMTAEEFAQVMTATFGGRFNDIQDALIANKLTMFDAMLALLDANDDAHNASFIRNLFGITKDELKELILMPIYLSQEKLDNDIRDQLGADSMLYRNLKDRINKFGQAIQQKSDATQFIMAALLRQELPAVMAGLSEMIRKDSRATWYAQAELAVQKCTSGTVSSNQLAQYLDDIREGRGASFLSVFKSPIRNSKISDIQARLRDPQQPTRSLDGLDEFLNYSIGQEGPHSLKCAVVKKILDINTELSRGEAEVLLGGVKHALNRVSDKPLVAMSELSGNMEKEKEEESDEDATLTSKRASSSR